LNGLAFASLTHHHWPATAATSKGVAAKEATRIVMKGLLKECIYLYNVMKGSKAISQPNTAVDEQSFESDNRSIARRAGRVL
jgi:hypothetical protein